MSRSFLWSYLQAMVQYLKMSHSREVIKKSVPVCPVLAGEEI